MSAPEPTVPPAIDGPATVVTVPSGPPWCKMPDRSFVYEYVLDPDGVGLSRDLLRCNPVGVEEVDVYPPAATFPTDTVATTVATVAVAPVPQDVQLPETGFTGVLLVAAALVTAAGVALKRVAR